MRKEIIGKKRLNCFGRGLTSSAKHIYLICIITFFDPIDIPTHIHTYIHAYIREYTYTYIIKNTHKYIYIYIYIYIYT